jgi:zinc transport system ATP-binding protein
VVLMGKLDPKKRLSRRSVANRRDATGGPRAYGNGNLCRQENRHAFRRPTPAGVHRPGTGVPPKLLLLDEPTASIDTKGQADFYRLLRELNQDITVLVVSHDLLVISRYVKSVACVNKKLHYHDQAEITGDMLETMYPCTVEEVCPVELVAHGLPHRVLADHEKDSL